MPLLYPSESIYAYQLVLCLTQHRVHSSLGVVEEAPVPTDQVEGVHQVGATEVLWRRYRLKTGPGQGQQHHHDGTSVG